MMENSFDLLSSLKAAGFLQTTRDPLWWPNSGSEQVVIGAILTQQTKWERVEESLANLEKHSICSLEGIAGADLALLQETIRPSGFYNTKAARLKLLAEQTLQTYGDFETFQNETDRAWLLAQKGIGMESADSILCYACYRPVMVVDSYTARLLGALGYTFEDYMSIQAWLHEGIEAHMDELPLLYGREIGFNEVYARFHGKIVEFAKVYIRGKKVALDILLQER